MLNPVPETISDQENVQKVIDTLYAPFEKEPSKLEVLRLHRKYHIGYLLRGLEKLPTGYTSLDASKPWICYWILHSLDLLDYQLPDELAKRVIRTIAACQHPEGGFGGGPNQLAHLACTYAAICTLAIIGTPEAYKVINRTKLESFLKRMKKDDGSFTVHEDGEADVRGSYCAIVSVSLTGLDHDNRIIKEEEREKAISSQVDLVGKATTEFILKCQTFEGGFGAVPHAEAHAGYTFCAIASLAIIEKLATHNTNSKGNMSFDLDTLGRFLVNAQCPQAGGFVGRTHKLVDGCYSFWCGALFPMFRKVCPEAAALYFDAAALQKYLLICCQNDLTGGLMDKPGKGEDYYHTCYCLSGLALAQRESPDLLTGQNAKDIAEIGMVIGDAGNLVHPIVPEYNLRAERVEGIKNFFTNTKLDC